MNAHFTRAGACIAALILLVSTAASVRGAQPYVPHFSDSWTRWDLPVDTGAASRTWMFGPDQTGAFEEAYAESPDGKRVVQYFDKSRMEISDPGNYDGSLWYVTNGLLATELITGRMQLGNTTFQSGDPAQVNVAGDPDDTAGPTYATFATLLTRPPLAAGSTIARRVSRSGDVSEDSAFVRYGVTAALLVGETQHQIASPFRDFMWSSGTLWDPSAGGLHTAALFENPFYVIGFPITEAYWTQVMVGGTNHDVLVQCFERRCLTYTPDNPRGWQVEAANIGAHYFQWRYGHLPQPAGSIAYIGPEWVSSCCGGLSGDIHVVAADGGGHANLTNSIEGELGAVWSPDGQKIAFYSRTGDLDIYVMNADGTDRRRLTDRIGPDYGPVWSPDSTRIAFQSSVYVDGAGASQIGVVNADGSGYHGMTLGLDPSWSPDGTRIAFVRQETLATQVYVMRADGTAIQQVTQGDSHKSSTGWTPDGEWITFWESSGIYHGVRPDGTGQHQLWDQEGIYISSDLAWSPDGSKVAFVDGSNAYVMNADGSGLVDLTRGLASVSFELSWSPDGRFIVYDPGSVVGAIRIVAVEYPEGPHRTIAYGMYARWSPAP